MNKKEAEPVHNLHHTQKLIANIGVTPSRGEDIPLYRPLIPTFSTSFLYADATLAVCDVCMVTLSVSKGCFR